MTGIYFRPEFTANPILIRRAGAHSTGIAQIIERLSERICPDFE
jgi:hypothetical protein